jgi:hypothetical protein
MFVQNEAGTVANANSYVTVDEFKAYHDMRGNAYTADNTEGDTEIEQALVRAFDYMERTYRSLFIGTKLTNTEAQTTEWPREDAVGRDGVEYEGIPRILKEAQSEYALRALSGDLLADTRASGQQVLSARSVSVEGISKSETYSGSRTQEPSYPLADLLLTPLLKGAGGTTLIRG